MERRATSFRLSDYTKGLIPALAEYKRVSRTSLLDMLFWEGERDETVWESNPKVWDRVGKAREDSGPMGLPVRFRLPTDTLDILSDQAARLDRSQAELIEALIIYHAEEAGITHETVPGVARNGTGRKRGVDRCRTSRYTLAYA